MKFPNKPKESKVFSVLESIIIKFIPLYIIFWVIIIATWLIFDYKLLVA